ncbi:MAG: alkaline phosphatase family protein [Verrucomicrobium sp.]|nr:alkaline phosphatase [Verrucomicrobium sp.]
MIKPWLIPLSTLAVLVTGLASPPSATEKPAGTFGGRHVLLVGIDGMRADALQLAMSQGLVPHLKDLADSGATTWTAHAGGELGGATQQPTISGPGWTSIFTGVWKDKHNVEGNATPDYNQPEVRGSYLATQAPHFAARLKAARPEARVSSFVSWAWIESYLVAAQPDAFETHSLGPGMTYPDRDRAVINKTLAYLDQTPVSPDVLVVHLDQLDHAGHTTGFTPENPEYMKSLQAIDSLFGEIRNALKVRPQAASESWLILVTTDHGGKNRAHGGQSPEERTIPIIASGPGIPAGQISTEPVGHTVIPPTIFRFLGVPVNEDWGWDKQAFGLTPAVVGK